jgi:hypothetical protein
MADSVFTGRSGSGEPANMVAITAAVFEDACGNLINLVQPKA